MTGPTTGRRRVLALLAGAGAAPALAGCMGSGYGFEGGRTGVQRAIADRLNRETRHDFVPDDDGQEDPPNEVYVAWRNGVLNVSIDVPATSTFCEDRYWNKTLQQNGTLMDWAEDAELAQLRTVEPALDDVAAIGFLTAMRRARPPEETPYQLSLRIDLSNAAVTYDVEEPVALYDRAVGGDDARGTVLDAFWAAARIDCSAASGPRPPEAPEG